MTDVSIVDRGASTGWTRLWGALLCAICGLALIPALAMAYYVLLWLPGLDGVGRLSALLLVTGPLPLGLGAVFGWRAARRGERRSLIGGAGFASLAVAVYAVPWTWGGRMLL